MRSFLVAALLATALVLPTAAAGATPRGPFQVADAACRALSTGLGAAGIIIVGGMTAIGRLVPVVGPLLAPTGSQVLGIIDDGKQLVCSALTS